MYKEEFNTNFGKTESYQKTRPHFSKQEFAGFWIDWGWNKLVSELHDKLVAIDPGYEILQVKEKFGGLRFYASHAIDTCGTVGNQCNFDHEIVLAEMASFKICQICGKEGSKRDKLGWITTLCDQCDENY